MADGSDSRPVPDPTVLTTEALQREVGGVKDLLGERLNGMDAVNVEKFAAVYAAIHADARLAEAQAEASKTAIGKTERSVEDRLRELTTLFRSETSALDGKIQSNAQRLDTFEARSSGAIDARSAAQDTQKLWIAVVGVVLTMAVLFTGVVTFLNNGKEPEVRVIERQSGPSTVIDRPNQVVVPEGAQ